VLNKPLRLARGVELLAALTLSLSSPVLAADSVRINDLVVAAPDPRCATRGDHEGSSRILRFLEHRRRGPAEGSHRTYLHRSHAAAGPTPTLFIATDIVKIENGRITDNWHIEDNLTLLQTMGVAKVGS
jgi:hypothetical protein